MDIRSKVLLISGGAVVLLAVAVYAVGSVLITAQADQAAIHAINPRVQARATVATLAVAVGVGGALVTALMVVLLDSLALRRLVHLRTAVDRLASEADDARLLLPVASQDEVGHLSLAIATLAHRLDAARAQTDERNRWLTTTLVCAGLGLWEWRHGSGIRIDAGAAALIGQRLAGNDLAAGDWWAMIHPTDRRTLRSAVARHLAGPSRPLDAMVRLTSAPERWLRIQGRLAGDGSRMLLGTVADATADVAAANDLRRARLDAEAATVAKSSFLANMSHEIRTPMNGVLGMAELLLAAPLAPDQAECAATLQRSARMLLGLLDDLLDLSKIEAGRLELSIAPYAPAQLLHDTAELFTGINPAIELVVELAPELPPLVRGDGIRLHQMLANLVSNAVKFSRCGTVRIAATCLNGRLRYTVEDQGIGISPARIGLLFTPFTQADAAVGASFGGTGLGLSIARHLARMMGGDIVVSSREGHGTRFVIDLPLVAEPGEPPSGPVIVLGRTSLLLVDDLPEQRRALANQLSTCGALVTQVASAGEALAELHGAVTAQRPFHAVVVDAGLPGFAGTDLARAVSLEPTLTGIPLILLLTRPGSEEGAGFAAVLAKPVRTRTLASTLITALHRPDPGLLQALAASPTQLPPSRVLLVEDNPVNQQVTSLMLRRLGAEVVVAANGREALDRLAEGSFTVVYLDCRMPVMDGFACIAALRAQEAGSTRHQPVVALTANAYPEDRARCLAAGMDGFLAKPLAERTLFRDLRQWVTP